MTQVLDTIRNGVDTEQMYGTLDAIKAQPELGVFQFRASTTGSPARTTAHDPGLLRRRPGGHLARPGVRARRRRAGRPARHRHRPQPRRVPAARARRLPDHLAGLRRRGAQVRLTEVSPRSRATWTCAARSGSPTRCATASSDPRELPRQGRRARRRSSARWSSAPSPAPRSTTWSPTASRSSWGSTSDELPPLSSMFELDRHTEPGARLVASPRRSPHRLRHARASHDRDGELSRTPA